VFRNFVNSHALLPAYITLRSYPDDQLISQTYSFYRISGFSTVFLLRIPNTCTN